MTYEYRTKGTCSQSIKFDIEDGRVYNIEFMGGCNGNLKGISSILDGFSVDEAISRLKGITCGFKPTSCPDQLAQALEKAKESE